MERELVGGECSYWACMPSKTMLRPGEALMDARRAPGAAEAICRDLDVEAALGWRDYIVSGYDDVGAVKWAQENGIDIIRGEGRIVAPGTIEVGGETHTAADIVIATGSDPVIPPIDGLRELEGVWTNREVTGVKPGELPDRLLVLGGGPVGVEMAQALRRMGTSVVLVEGSGAPACARAEAARRGARQGAGRGGHRAALRPARVAAHVARARTTCSSSPTARS